MKKIVSALVMGSLLTAAVAAPAAFARDGEGASTPVNPLILLGLAVVAGLAINGLTTDDKPASS